MRQCERKPIMKELTNFNTIIGCIKSDNLDEFRHLLSQNNMEQLNDLIKQRYRFQISHLCAQCDAHKICKYIFETRLIDKELLTSRDVEGKTSLHTAIIFGSLECARVLLDHGAEVDALKRGDWSSLMISVTKANCALISLLLQHGADISLRNKDGWSALHLAVRNGDLKMLDLLDEHLKKRQLENLWCSGSNIHRTVLHIAAIQGNREIFCFLINRFKGDSLNPRDRCGVSVLMDAARANSIAICQLLNTYICQLNADQTDLSGRSALHMAAQSNAIDAIRFLVIQLQCNPNLGDLWQQTPLHLAVREGHLQATTLLIELGASQLADSQNRTPIDIAVQYNHHHICQYLNQIKL